MELLLFLPKQPFFKSVLTPEASVHSEKPLMEKETKRLALFYRQRV